MPQSELSKALHSRPFQMKGARFAMEHKRVLIADEPGLGKTIQAIAAVIGSKTTGSVLIVAPKTAAYVTWPAELARWLSDISPDDPVHVIGGEITKLDRLRILQAIFKWDTENDPYTRSPMAMPSRQWIIVSPNYLRFKYKLNAKDKFVYDSAGDKIIIPVREAIVPLLGIEYAAIIIDEAHQTLAGSRGDVKTMSAQSRGLRMLDVRDDGLRIALTGTPFRGKHENLWGIANWLKPEEYTGYWPWVMRYFQVYHDPVFKQDIIGKLRSERELAKDARSFMIRRTKKKVLPELPEKQYGGTPLWPKKKPPQELHDAVAKYAKAIVGNPKDVHAKQSHERACASVAAWYDKHNPIAVWLPMDGKQAKAYLQMKREAQADIENGTLLANSVLAEMTRLKQFANSYGLLDSNGDFQPQFPSNKFDWLLQFFKERGIDDPEPSGSRVVVASQFTRHINLFAAELRERHKINCYVLTGATSAQQRVQIQREFQSGKTDKGGPSAEVLLMNTKAGGTAITLDAADEMVVIDATHNVDDQVQLEDRIHRISRLHNVTIYNLASKGTIDQQILRATRKMGRSLKRILDTPDKALALLDS